jgi:hypothetical protein
MQECRYTHSGTLTRYVAIALLHSDRNWRGRDGNNPSFDIAVKDADQRF